MIGAATDWVVDVIDVRPAGGPTKTKIIDQIEQSFKFDTIENY